MFSVLTFPGLREEPERTIYGTRTCHGLLCAHLWLPMVPVASVSKREEPTHTPRPSFLHERGRLDGSHRGPRTPHSEPGPIQHGGQGGSRESRGLMWVNRLSPLSPRSQLQDARPPDGCRVCEPLRHR